jgi:hypothetical protein
MGLFVCEGCGCIENTALGVWWSRHASYWPEDVRGKALCSACAPATFPDGALTGKGKWHGEFERRQATEEDRHRVKNPWVLDASSEGSSGDPSR